MSRYYSPEGGGDGGVYNLDKTLDSEFCLKMFCFKIILGTKHTSLIYLVSLRFFVL